jgi:hemerythrin
MESGLSPFLPEALLVDLPEVDAQHEEVFMRIESLKASCFENDYVDIAEFQGLLDCFALHFATEEHLAEEAGVDFTAHAKIHRDTLGLLHKALSDLRNGGEDAHSFLRYAEFWFERHIRENDKLFVATLKQSQHFKLPSGYRAASGHYSSARV